MCIGNDRIDGKSRERQTERRRWQRDISRACLLQGEKTWMPSGLKMSLNPKP